jgi:hypothetical protein
VRSAASLHAGEPSGLSVTPVLQLEDAVGVGDAGDEDEPIDYVSGAKRWRGRRSQLGDNVRQRRRQRSRAAARRSSVRLMVCEFRERRSSTPDIRLLNSMADVVLKSSLHSVTRLPPIMGSMRYPQVE